MAINLSKWDKSPTIPLHLLTDYLGTVEFVKYSFVCKDVRTPLVVKQAAVLTANAMYQTREVRKTLCRMRRFLAYDKTESDWILGMQRRSMLTLKGYALSFLKSMHSCQLFWLTVDGDWLACTVVGEFLDQ